MMTAEGVEVHIHSCLKSVLDEGGMSTLPPFGSPPPPPEGKKSPGTH